MDDRVYGAAGDERLFGDEPGDVGNGILDGGPCDDTAVNN
jgi:hypothetical protein